MGGRSSSSATNVTNRQELGSQIGSASDDNVVIQGSLDGANISITDQGAIDAAGEAVGAALDLSGDVAEGAFDTSLQVLSEGTNFAEDVFETTVERTAESERNFLNAADVLTSETFDLVKDSVDKASQASTDAALTVADISRTAIKSAETSAQTESENVTIRALQIGGLLLGAFILTRVFK